MRDEATVIGSFDNDVNLVISSGNNKGINIVLANVEYGVEVWKKKRL